MLATAVIDDKTCEERLWKMKHSGETNFYLCEINRDMVIDATYKGNKSRYINHSCCPNTEMQKWYINGLIFTIHLELSQTFFSGIPAYCGNYLFSYWIIFSGWWMVRQELAYLRHVTLKRASIWPTIISMDIEFLFWLFSAILAFLVSSLLSPSVHLPLLSLTSVAGLFNLAQIKIATVVL